MPSSSSNGSAPRYAPEDPTLPKPWKGLVDGSTGYLYYWNPETNVTQYEKPVAKEKLPGPPPLPPPPPKSASVSSSVHRGESLDDDRRSRTHQRQDGTAHGHGYGSLSSRTSVRGHGSSDAGGGLSIEAYRRQHEITINGDDVPPPYMTFESTGFPSEILKEVHRAGFAAPTPIQAQSWPIALQSRDVVAIAKTGSGKTLGYLIPGFMHLKRVRNNPRNGPTVLVLAPTRELATQIQVEADKFGRSSKISCTCVYGGAPKGPQLRDLDRGVDVVVATPGRLNDILEMRRINLRQVTYLVLDEADRMLDMGFEPQIRKIVKEIPHCRRQTLMFTATWPKEVRKIAADLLVHPVQVNIGSIDELVANKAITQYVEVIKPIEKQRRLEQILRSQEPGSKVIIFCSTKRMCDQLARTITRQFGAAAIHGDKNQSERDRVLGHFRTGRCPILVATDVAARGLDIKDIRVVINYDFPTGVEDYVHRIGRTGRAGATGVSYTFFSDQDSKYALDLVKVLEGAGQRVPPELCDMVSRGGYGGRSRRWGSDARDRDRSNGIGRSSVLGYGGRGGRGPPPLGRLDTDRAVHRSDHDSRDRYDRDRGYQDRREAEARGREDIKAITKVRVHNSRSKSHSLSPSPKRGRGGRAGSGRSRSRSLGQGRSRDLNRNLKSTPASDLDRNLKSTTARRQHKSSPASYDDGEIRDDQLEDSPSPRRRSRSRSPIQLRDDHGPDRLPIPRKRSRSPVHRSRSPRRKRSRSLIDRLPSPKERSRSPIPVIDDDRLDGSPSPKKARVESPYTSNGKREGYVSPGEWRRRSPNYPDGDGGPPIKKPVRSQPLVYDGDEEEEGMIMPDEEEGMINPDEDSNSVR